MPREIALLKKLQHPMIIPLLGVWAKKETQEVVFITEVRRRHHSSSRSRAHSQPRSCPYSHTRAAHPIVAADDGGKPQVVHQAREDDPLEGGQELE